VTGYFQSIPVVAKVLTRHTRVDINTCGLYKRKKQFITQ